MKEKCSPAHEIGILGERLMKVTVRFFGPLREVTQTKIEEVEVPKDTTVEDLMRLLSKKYDRKFIESLYDNKGELRTNFRFVINGRIAPTYEEFTKKAKLAQAKTKLREHDDLAIMPIIGGG